MLFWGLAVEHGPLGGGHVIESHEHDAATHHLSHETGLDPPEYRALTAPDECGRAGDGRPGC